MLYLTGVHALNIDNSLETCGDWHASALDWSKIVLVDSEKSIFKDWGIETDKTIPDNEGLFNVANDLRAILDLMTNKNNLGYLKGFRNDFICVDTYNELFFSKVILLKSLPHWEDINNLMKKEFMFEWDNFLEEFGG